MFKKHFLTSIFILLIFQLSAASRDSVIVPDLGGESSIASRQRPAKNQVFNKDLWLRSFLKLERISLPFPGELTPTFPDQLPVIFYSELGPTRHLQDVIELLNYLENKVYAEPFLGLDSLLIQQYQQDWYEKLMLSEYPVNNKVVKLRPPAEEIAYLFPWKDSLYYNQYYRPFTESTNQDTSWISDRQTYQNKSAVLTTVLNNLTFDRNFSYRFSDFKPIIGIELQSLIKKNLDSLLLEIREEDEIARELFATTFIKVVDQSKRRNILAELDKLKTFVQNQRNPADALFFQEDLINYYQRSKARFKRADKRCEALLEAVDYERSITYMDIDLSEKELDEILLRLSSMKVDSVELTLVSNYFNEIIEMKTKINGNIELLKSSYATHFESLSTNEDSLYQILLNSYQSFQEPLDSLYQKAFTITRQVHSEATYQHLIEAWDIVQQFDSFFQKQISQLSVSHRYAMARKIDDEYYTKVIALNTEFLIRAGETRTE